jgi:hypothetical protein
LSKQFSNRNCTGRVCGFACCMRSVAFCEGHKEIHFQLFLCKKNPEKIRLLSFRTSCLESSQKKTSRLIKIKRFFHCKYCGIACSRKR